MVCDDVEAASSVRETIVGAHGVAAGLAHDAVAADAAHGVDGGAVALIGGVCERTPQVRAALVAHAQGRNAAVTDCSKVKETDLAAVTLLTLNDTGLTALSEATGLEAKTIHRLLEVDPRNGGFRRDADNPLRCGLLVVDETSMVEVKAFGGLKPMVRRKLRARAVSGERTSKSTPAPCRSRALSPGTRLVREWHGVPHTVEVLEKGFFYESKTYRSLSRIAHVITGARWSGPRFFGL